MLWQGWIGLQQAATYFCVSNSLCCRMGMMRASVCRLHIAVKRRQPVAIRSAVFWHVCKLPHCVADRCGDQIGAIAMCRQMALKAISSDSMFLPQGLPVIALSMFLRYLNLTATDLAWWLNVSWLSNVTPSSLVLLTVGRVCPAIIIWRARRISLFQVENKVAVDFSHESSRLRLVNH